MVVAYEICMRKRGVRYRLESQDCGLQENSARGRPQGQTLRSPLKVAAQDDHTARTQELRETRAAGMQPSHAVPAATLVK
jgi:hypothetical protein